MFKPLVMINGWNMFVINFICLSDNSYMYTLCETLAEEGVMVIVRGSMRWSKGGWVGEIQNWKFINFTWKKNSGSAHGKSQVLQIVHHESMKLFGIIIGDPKSNIWKWILCQFFGFSVTYAVYSEGRLLFSKDISPWNCI